MEGEAYPWLRSGTSGLIRPERGSDLQGAKRHHKCGRCAHIESHPSNVLYMGITTAVSGLAVNRCWVHVCPKAHEHRSTQSIFVGPFRELHLDDYLRTDPLRACLG